MGSGVGLWETWGRGGFLRVLIGFFIDRRDKGTTMAFKYEKCDKEGFADGTKLRRHMKRAHATDVYTCSHCGKQYGSRDTLNRHLKVCASAKTVLKNLSEREKMHEDTTAEDDGNKTVDEKKDETKLKEKKTTTEEGAKTFRVQVEYLPCTSAQALKETNYRCPGMPKGV